VSPPRAALVTLALLAAASGCRPPAPLPEVKVHATVSPLAAGALVTLAANRRVARVVIVPEVRDAEVAWFGDPTQALEAAALLVEGSAPAQGDVEARWRDGRGRFFPLCARARVLLVGPGAVLPVAPGQLRDLADPRLAGRQALVPFGRGDGPLTAAALALVLGEPGALAFLDGVARQQPRLAASEGEVQGLVARGAAAFGLAGSEQGAAGAASAAALEVVYPDQGGSGTMVFPTAVALLRGGASSRPAQRLLEWMAGADAEQLVVARAPGLLPLRGDVPLPPGVRSAAALRSPALDWERLAEMKRTLAPRLERWPAP
jgi:iron(III) transport system substrate-binding protein